MTLFDIGLLCAGGLLYAALPPGRWRRWALLIASVIAIYWLQPALSIRFLDFWLPTLTLVITVLCWLMVRQPADNVPYRKREDSITLAVVIGLVLLLAANRYLVPEARITASRPPEITLVLLALGLAAVPALIIVRRGWPLVGISGLVALFVIIKTGPLAQSVSYALRTGAGQDTSLASGLDLGWLGFSYVAFRLIHTLRDRQMGILPPLNLREYLTYVIFFPAYTAGPIDRAERFQQDDAALPGMTGLDAGRITEAGGRVVMGLFKKFVIADTLALIALDATKATQVESALALWVLLYAYAFRLFFDFSGYTDIAIGIGLLFGVRLPENFDRPYLKPSITAFWQSWHMTLTNWVRFYIFSPLSRSLLRRRQRLSNDVIMFICHLTTMIVIGLWHGVTWAFFAWGVWHGLALFGHKLWSDRTRSHYRRLSDYPHLKAVYTIGGALLTFHVVTLGWVWFALPDVGQGWAVLARLLGLV